MRQFEQFNPLAELLRTYCKACDDDPGVHEACQHLVQVFEGALLEDDPRAAFVEQLQKDASYSSWKGPAPSPSCPWCFQRIASPQEDADWWLCPCGKSFGVTAEDQAETEAMKRATPGELVERAAVIISREVPSYGNDDVLGWFQDYWKAGGQHATGESLIGDEDEDEDEDDEDDYPSEEERAEEAAEQAAWDKQARNEKAQMAEIFRHWPTNVLLMLKRMLTIEAPRESHANRGSIEINMAIEVIAKIVRKNRGDDPDDPAWEQGPVRQVLSEFTDYILRVLHGVLYLETFETHANVEFLKRRMALIEDIRKTRRWGPGRTDIDESFEEGK